MALVEVVMTMKDILATIPRIVIMMLLQVRKKVLMKGKFPYET